MSNINPYDVRELLQDYHKTKDPDTLQKAQDLMKDCKFFFCPVCGEFYAQRQNAENCCKSKTKDFINE
jgi:rubrerythrin